MDLGPFCHQPSIKHILQRNLLENLFRIQQFLTHLRAYSMVLRVLHPLSIVQHPMSGVRRLVFDVLYMEHNSHSIEVNKPLLNTYICNVHKKIVVPLIMLDFFFAWKKQFLTF